MKHLMLLVTALFIFSSGYSQSSSRNGYWLHNTDTIRMLIVFAEVNDYTSDIFLSAVGVLTKRNNLLS